MIARACVRSWWWWPLAALVACSEPGSGAPSAPNTIQSGTGAGGAAGSTVGGRGGAGAAAAGTQAINPTAGRAGSAGQGGSAGTATAAGTGGMTGTGGDGSGMGGSGGGPSAECGGGRAQGHFQLEDLDRGLVAVRADGGNYVGWRMLGYEYDADAHDTVAYNLYRDGAKVATVTNSTNYEDRGAGADASYTVSAVLGGSECAQSAAVVPWAAQYLRIPLEPPAAGTVNGSSYSYTSGTTRETNGSANDASPGDVDGDGRYELIVKWDPSNSQDNSKPGHTGPVYIDCYTLDGATYGRARTTRSSWSTTSMAMDARKSRCERRQARATGRARISARGRPRTTTTKPTTATETATC
jgi:rhamnogalacturonan endolyase